MARLTKKELRVNGGPSKGDIPLSRKPAIKSSISGEASKTNSSASILPFIMEVDTTKAGSASDTMVILTKDDEDYSFDIDWGDSNIETYTSSSLASITHTYSVGGVYSISIFGEFPRFLFNSGGDVLKPTKILAWGDVRFSLLTNAFRGCANLVAAYSDTPQFKPSISASNLGFRGAALWNGSFIGADFSLLTSAKQTFQDCTVYNQPYPDMPIVTNCLNLFRDTAFNQLLPSIPLVESIKGLLAGTPFNQDMTGLSLEFVDNADDFLLGNTALSTANYDTYLQWIDGTTINNTFTINFGAATYSAAGVDGRAYLVAQGLTVIDGGAA